MPTSTATPDATWTTSDQSEIISNTASMVQNPVWTAVHAFYNFLDGDASDTTGNYDGTPVGTPTFQTGGIDKQVSFDGTNYISLPIAMFGDVTDLVMHFKIKSNNISKSQTIIRLDDNNHIYGGVTIDTSSNLIRFYVFHNDGTNKTALVDYTYTADYSYDDDFVISVYLRENYQVQLWVNGYLRDYEDIGTLLDGNTGNEITLGGNLYNGTSSYFEGTMDYALFDTANQPFTGAYHRKLWNKGNPTKPTKFTHPDYVQLADNSNNLAAYFPFDSDTSDASGNGLDMGIGSATIDTSNKKLGAGSMLLDRSLGQNPDGVASGYKLPCFDAPRTARAWIYPKTASINDYQYVFQYGNPSVNKHEFGFGIYADDLIFTEGLSGVFMTSDDPFLSVNNWYHVVVKMNSTMLVEAYINGSKVYEGQFTDFITDPNTNLTVGCSSAGIKEFDGNIDGLAILWGDWSEAEILLDYASGSGRTLEPDEYEDGYAYVTMPADVTATQLVNWLSIAATTGGNGTVECQISLDSGTTWLAWDGVDSWDSQDLDGTWNTLTVANTNASSLSIATDTIRMRFRFTADTYGADEPTLSQAAMGYTQNEAPQLACPADKPEIGDPAITTTSTFYPFQGITISDAEPNITKAWWKVAGGEYAELTFDTDWQTTFENLALLGSAYGAGVWTFYAYVEDSYGETSTPDSVNVTIVETLNAWEEDYTVDTGADTYGDEFKTMRTEVTAIKTLVDSYLDAAISTVISNQTTLEGKVDAVDAVVDRIEVDTTSIETKVDAQTTELASVKATVEAIPDYSSDISDMQTSLSQALGALLINCIITPTYDEDGNVDGSTIVQYTDNTLLTPLRSWLTLTTYQEINGSTKVLTHTKKDA